MDHNVPDWLMGFLEGAAPDPLASSGDNGRSGSSSDKGPRDFSNIKGLDIEQNVEELRRSHAINKQLLDDALHSSEPNEQTIMLRQRNYERSFELLRKAETTLIEIQKQRGGLVDPEPIRAEIAQVLESLRLMRETMPRRILVALEQILPRRLQRIFAVLQKPLMTAVEKARDDEEKIFRDLGSLRGPEDVAKLLAA